MVKHPTNRRQRPHGFTLIEMVIVMAIVMILLSIAVPNYTSSVQRAKDSVMRQNLFTMRQLIYEFTLDKQRAPQSLDEIKEAGYMKEIPVDPCTHQKDWVTEQEDVLLSADQTQPGITNIHSNCALRSSDGTPYSEF